MFYSQDNQSSWLPEKVYNSEYILLILTTPIEGCLAEWLRRWSRIDSHFCVETIKPMGNSRVGSNPAAVDLFFLHFFQAFRFCCLFLSFCFSITDSWDCQQCQRVNFTFKHLILVYLLLFDAIVEKSAQFLFKSRS